MGLFTSSETTQKREQILQYISILNRSLRDIANIIDKDGINGSSINTINEIFKKGEENAERMSNIVRSMSDSQLDGFTVPWMDGKYIGIMMWIASYVGIINKMVSKFESYANNNL